MNAPFDIDMQNWNWGRESHKWKPGQTRDCCGQWSFKELYLKKSGNTVRDYAEDLDVSPTTTSRHLKLIGKVKKKWINGFLMSWMRIIHANVMKHRLPFFFVTKIILYLVEMEFIIKSGFCTTIVKVLCIDWMQTRLHHTFKSLNSINVMVTVL